MFREVVEASDGRWTIEGREDFRTDDITLACYVADELYQARGRLNESPKENWVDKVGGLPDYIDRIAVHLVGKGMERGHAIATAVNAVKKACATGDLNYPGIQKENAGSQAEACAAVAEWEAKKAKSHAGGGKK
jgi:hypothetical protein